MLELIINKKENERFGEMYISTIKDEDKVLATFDEEKGAIDIDVCKPYIGQEFKLSKYTERHTKNKNILNIDTSKTAILRDVVEDEKGIRYLKYDIIDPVEEQFI